MKKLLVILIALAGTYVAYEQTGGDVSAPRVVEGGDERLAEAFAGQRTSFQVAGTGTVTRVLPDDNDGSRHQRFILRLESGQSLLVAHNIDLAPRIATLEPGDTVSFYGEYEWNPRGGVIHWTHHDPQGRHVGGWLEHEGRRYQ